MKIIVLESQRDLLFQWIEQQFGYSKFFYEFFDIRTDTRFFLEEGCDEHIVNDVHMFDDYAMFAYRESVPCFDHSTFEPSDEPGFVIYKDDDKFVVQAVFGKRIGESCFELHREVTDEELEEQYGHMLDRYLLKLSLDRNELQPMILR